MPEHGDLPIDLRLDRYYDEVFLGDPAGSGKDALDPSLAATVRRLRELDAVEPANPEFASKLWKDLVLAQDTAIDNRAREISFAAANPVQSRIRSLPWPDFKVPGERRKWFVAQFAMAALLVITLVASWFTFRPGQHNPGTPNSDSDMPMVYGNPARTGVQPGPGPAGKPHLLWRFQTFANIFDSAVIVNGVAYIGNTDGLLIAIDTKTGKERWRAKPGASLVGAAAVAGGTVYAQSSDGLFAVDAETGVKLWDFTVYPGYDSTPVVVDGAVYMSTRNAGSPAVVDGVVYVGGDADSTFYAVDAATGAELWQTKATTNGLYALDAATGAMIWQFITNSTVRSGPAVLDGTAYFGTKDGIVHALDIANVAERWQVTIGGDVRSSPTVVDGTIYIGGPYGDLYALDTATGKERWRSPIGNTDEASPAVVDGIVYAGGNDALRALDASNGQELWNVFISFEAYGFPRTEPDEGPVVVGGVVYLSEGTSLVAFGN
jgi:outer membrane protein assembly factor BamB